MNPKWPEWAQRQALAEDGLPEFSISHTIPGKVARLFKHARHPDRPAAFD